MPNQVSLGNFLAFAFDHLSFSMTLFGVGTVFSLYTIIEAVILTTFAAEVINQRRFPDKPLGLLYANRVAVGVGALLVAAAVTLGAWPFWAVVPLAGFYGFALVVFK